MIKNGFKKIIGIGLFVVFGGLFSSCFGATEIQTIISGSVGETSYIIDNWSELAFNLDSNGNFNTYEIGDSDITKNLLRYIPPSNSRGIYIFWDENSKLNEFTIVDGMIMDNYQASGFCITNKGDEIQDCYNWTNGNYIYNYDDIQEFAGTIKEYKYIATKDLGNGWVQNSRPYMSCWSNDTKSFCSSFGHFNKDTCKANSICIDGTHTLQTSYLQFDNFPDSILGESPLHGGGGGDSGGGNLVPVFSDVDNAISYFENTKGYNESMCYVGTYNLTGVYGTPGVSFQEGTGDTIFQLYNSLYSGYGSNLVTNVGNFIDVWTLNYFQWFYNSNEEYGVRRLATYNGPDTLYDINYENLTFPFTDNPVAIFFMASNLYDGYDNIYNYGSYVSSYCYMKLNYDNIKSGDIDYVNNVVPLLPSAIDNNIKDYVKYDFNKGNTGYYYSPDWISSWTGDYELSDNLDLDNVFTNFLDNFNSKLGNIDFGYTFGIIPDWILYPLIFLILFRIMKH